MSNDTITLLSVSVGQPALLGQRRGEDVVSGIRKRPVDAHEVEVALTNIAGDQQADLRNHGGRDKAIYCYPAINLGRWREEIGYAGDGVHAPFGENLSVAGVDEQAVCIGDVWRWGTATLQVSQPRWPCYKLDMHSGIPGLMTKLIHAGRSGWYLRVLEPGTAPTSGEIEVIERDPAALPVARAFQARRDPHLDPEAYAWIMAHPALAAAWSR